MTGLWFLAILPLCLAATFGPGSNSEYFDLLDSGRAEWRLAFRGTAKAGTSVLEAYQSGKGIPNNVAEACKGTDWTQECTSHYRNNDVFNSWASSSIKDVLFGIVKDGAIVRTLNFNGYLTGPMSWFSKCDLKSTCYADVHNQPKNFFSIQGDDFPGIVNRHFLVGRNAGGCDKDAGWFVAIDGPNRPCDWEKKWGDETPIFLYSPSLTYTTWSSDGVKAADAIVIFLRYGPTTKPGIVPPIIEPPIIEPPIIEPPIIEPPIVEPPIIEPPIGEETEGPGKKCEYVKPFLVGRRRWRVAFVGCAGVKVRMLQGWFRNEYATAEGPCGRKALLKSKCTAHYRNADALDNWKDSGVQEVLVGLIKNGKWKKFIRFNAKDKDSFFWFSKYTIIDQKRKTWTDLKDGEKHIVGIQGHFSGDTNRNFFVSKKYGSRNGDCVNDEGWMAVIDGDKRRCDWEKGGDFPRIVFAKGPKAVNWAKGPIADADKLVVMLSYKKSKPTTKPQVLPPQISPPDKGPSEEGPGKKCEYVRPFLIGRRRWRVAFVGCAGVKVRMLQGWFRNEHATAEGPCGRKALLKSKCTAHYRNADALDNWKDSGVEEALVGIIKNGKWKKFIRFNAKDKDNFFWFGKYTIIDQKRKTWTDLKDGEKHIVGIQGHFSGDTNRNFFVSKKYGSQNGDCVNDEGWLAVIDGDIRRCDWEKGGDFPRIVFAKGPKAVNWAKGPIADGDKLVVMLSYKKSKPTTKPQVLPPQISPPDKGPSEEGPGKKCEYKNVFNVAKRRPWRVAFVGCAGIKKSMYQAYLKGGELATADGPCRGSLFKKACTGHYRNDDALDNWSNVAQVLVGVIKNGKFKKFVRFSAEGADKISWFSNTKLIKQQKKSWIDLKKGPWNIFSIQGHLNNRHRRQFFMNRNYGGCQNDMGWLVVIDGDQRACPWAQGGNFPKIMYAKGPKAQNWKTGKIMEADKLVIYLKYKKGLKPKLG